MAFATGSPTSIEDLVSSLFSFAVSAGWTQNELDTVNNRGTLSRNNVFVSFRWDDSPSTDLGLYQSLGFTGSTDPHNQPEDSGIGDTTVPINSGRRVNFLHSGPYLGSWFFSDDGTPPHYVHCVVHYSSGQYRHFGFGELIKSGTWTGGEYVAGGYWHQGLAAGIDEPDHSNHSVGLDGTNGITSRSATVHAESLPFQDGTSKWLVVSQNPASAAGTDRAGNPRGAAFGTSRGGLWTHHVTWQRVGKVTAFKALAPIDLVYKAQPGTQEVNYYLGTQRDVAVVNIGNVAEADTIQVGDETWMVFPWASKGNLNVGVQESSNAGFAYRQVL